MDSVLAIRRGLTGSSGDKEVVEVGNEEVAIPAEKVFPTASSDTTSLLAPSISGPEIVDTVNGVPIYAHTGQGSSAGAVFSP